MILGERDKLIIAQVNDVIKADDCVTDVIHTLSYYVYYMYVKFMDLEQSIFIYT